MSQQKFIEENLEGAGAWEGRGPGRGIWEGGVGKFEVIEGYVCLRGLQLFTAFSLLVTVMSALASRNSRRGTWEGDGGFGKRAERGRSHLGICESVWVVVFLVRSIC